jgi:hypothetical protein
MQTQKCPASVAEATSLTNSNTVCFYVNAALNTGSGTCTNAFGFAPGSLTCSSAHGLVSGAFGIVAAAVVSFLLL